MCLYAETGGKRREARRNLANRHDEGLLQIAKTTGSKRRKEQEKGKHGAKAKVARQSGLIRPGHLPGLGPCSGAESKIGINCWLGGLTVTH